MSKELTGGDARRLRQTRADGTRPARRFASRGGRAGRFALDGKGAAPDGISRVLALIAVLVTGVTLPAQAQTVTPAPMAAPGSRPDGRVTFLVNTASRTAEGAGTRRDTELATMFTFRVPDVDAPGLEAGADLRYSTYTTIDRPDRVALFDGYVGARFGERGQFRARAGHMWLPDLGTAGALAGGLVCETQVPFVRGGAELLVRQLVDQLRARGFETDRVSLPFKWYPKDEILATPRPGGCSTSPKATAGPWTC